MNRNLAVSTRLPGWFAAGIGLLPQHFRFPQYTAGPQARTPRLISSRPAGLSARPAGSRRPPGTRKGLGFQLPHPDQRALAAAGARHRVFAGQPDHEILPTLLGLRLGRDIGGSHAQQLAAQLQVLFPAARRQKPGRAGVPAESPESSAQRAASPAQRAGRPQG